MDPIVADVNPEQREAILHREGPLLVVAGAGSGKTRVVTRRVAHLIDGGVPAREIVALTFTNKAAKEMRDRVTQLVAARDLWICTFHAFAARALRIHADRIGFTREFSIYDTEDKNRLLRALLKELSYEEVRPAQVALALTRVKNGMERPELPGWQAEKITRVMGVYAERMREANAMDFDDLLVFLLDLLDRDDEVRARLQARAHWLLVDEYQDTNQVQYAILRHLAEPGLNLCATGDPDQSIYRWRGATIRNILDFERDFPGARVVTLDRNYRSTRAILSVANAVIRYNQGRRYEKDLRTERQGGVPVREIRCRDEEDEAVVVARDAAAWLKRERSPRDIAVFYRVNAQSRLLERSFTEQGIPYRIVGAVEFYKRKEVKDVLAYVRLARNPADSAAFWRVLNVPTRGIGKTTAERLRAAAQRAGRPARQVLRDREGLGEFGRARKALARLAELLDGFEALDPEQPALLVHEAVVRTKYREFLGEGTPQAETDRIENVRELVNAAAEYERREPHGGIDGFLEENALVSDQDTYDDRAAAVTLMTVHSAKGLEFPCVLTVGLEEQLFPHALSLDTPEELDEERRLFYVAVTRAQDELVLLHGQRRMRAGLPEPVRPSRFLDEIPDELLEVEDRTFDPFGYTGDEPVFREEAAPGFRAGDRVLHGHFGRGRVMSVRKTGGATRITVDFDQAGRRELALAFANLKKV